MPYRNVVVATDGSATASIAVRHAAMLAAAVGARLTVVTAFAPGGLPVVDDDRIPEELRWRVTQSAEAERLAAGARIVARESGVADVHVRVGGGDPADVIVQAAEDTGGDVIVLGSKGMASRSRFLAGSVPNKVSHHAPCDVLIVHTAK